MNIKRIEHIAINTRDIEASIRFYRDILGFSQLETIDNGDNTITYFLMPDRTRLELFDYMGSNSSPARQESDAGMRHFAFEVDDVKAHEKELKEKGINIILPTTDLDHLGARVLLFTDPDGVVIEFCQKKD